MNRGTTIASRPFGRADRNTSRLHRWARALALGAPLAGLAILGGAALAPVKAQEMVEIGDGRVGAVRATIGRSHTLQTSRGFVDLVVGDPEIADVMPLTDRSLYVLGKKVGITNVSVYNAGKQLVGVIEVEVAYDQGRLAADIDRVAPGTGARVGSANGRTILSGPVADGVAAAKAVGIAKQYGPEVLNDLTVRTPQQVMLEVRFVEASRNAGKDLGINWQAVGRNINNAGTAGHVIGGITGTGLATGNALVSGNVPFGTVIGRVLSSGIDADILVQALEERGLARRLAEPNLITMSGEKASFLAGGEFPIPVAAERDRITVDYKKFGVSLTFTPTVLANGVINLRIEPEVSQLDFTNTVRTASVSVPALIVRRANTVVELRDGQSFAVAGLLQSVNQEMQEQLPWLGDVPILGALFRSTSFERKETDLAIIVTPRLVKPAKPGQRLKTPLDNTVPGNDVDLFLNGRAEVSVNKARLAGGPPPPPTGHILNIR
ncbi:MAG TPA: type II and III secretion system protein family protein [Microvirga sp.]|jgi:pilus assembly protein CpaC|nr:type II and III secretion system protein family protein [Microvirga sp.]